MYKKEKFKNILSKFSEKYTRRLSLPTILRLISKLEEKGIRDNEIVQMLSKLLTYLNAISKGDTSRNKTYRRSVNSLIEYTEKKYYFIAKGTYISRYISIFISIGIAIGAGIGVAIDFPGFIGAGIAIGAGIGLAIGSSKEDELKKEGKLY